MRRPWRRWCRQRWPRGPTPTGPTRRLACGRRVGCSWCPCCCWYCLQSSRLSSTRSLAAATHRHECRGVLRCFTQPTIATPLRQRRGCAYCWRPARIRRRAGVVNLQGACKVVCCLGDRARKHLLPLSPPPSCHPPAQARAYGGLTPLHTAARNGSPEAAGVAIRLLVVAGASVEAQLDASAGGGRPLHMAVAANDSPAGMEAAVAALLAAGACVGATNGRGQQARGGEGGGVQGPAPASSTSS